MALSPSFPILIAVNDVGDASLCSLSTGCVISVYPFKGVVMDVSFSPDGKFFIAGSVDSTCRLFSVYNIPKIFVYTLSGHKNPIVGAFLFRNSVNVLTVSSDGMACLWECNTPFNELKSTNNSESGSLFKISNRYRYSNSADVQMTIPVSAVAFHKDLRLLATGFESGLLLLHTFPDFVIISEVK
ncbi:unnamed protein product [Trichobilharzia regenti]|nr:unnamed protein product [Trichobilharzia regenti]